MPQERQPEQRTALKGDALAESLAVAVAEGKSEAELRFGVIRLK